MDEPCVFCTSEGGRRVYADALCRVVVADEPFAGFCRVIVSRHVREVTDLPEPDRLHMMRVVFALESALRALLAPYKMNVASLGNAVPHVHWHVIPRYEDDAHFPNPIWSDIKRTPVSTDLARRKALVPRLREVILSRFEGSLL